MSIGAVDKLTGKFTEHLHTLGEIELFVERGRLVFHSETVYEDDNARRSIAIKLDHAGVRRMLFSPGILPEEVVDFLEVLTTEFDEHSLEDDIVTLMWDKHLTHVKMFVLNNLAADEQYSSSKVDASDPTSTNEGGSASSVEVLLPETRRRRNVHGAAQLPNTCIYTDDLTDDEQYDSSKVDASDPTIAYEEGSTSPVEVLPPEARRMQNVHGAAQLANTCINTKEKLFPLTEEEFETTKHDVAEEDTHDVSTKLADILFEIIQDSPEEHASANIRRVIGQLVIMHVRAGQFTNAVELLEQTEDMADGTQLTDEESQALRKLTTEVITPNHVAELRDILIANPEASLEGLGRLIKWFPTESLSELTQLMTLGRQQSQVEALLLEVYADHPEMLFEPLIESEDDLALRIIELLEQVATESSVTPLGGLLPRLGGDVRTQLVKVIARFQTDEAKQMLLALICDANPEIRRTVIKALSQFDGGIETEELRAQLAYKDFHSRSLEEKKGLLMTLAGTEREGAIEFLREVIGRKRWFESKKQEETRACAVLALGQTGCDEVRTALQQYAQDKSESIRGAARLAMSNLTAKLAAAAAK